MYTLHIKFVGQEDQRSSSAILTAQRATRRWMLLARTIGHIRPFVSVILPPCTQQLIRPSVLSSFDQVRWGSMKVKRIQKKQPLEKNRIRRLIRGTRLEPKKPKKKNKHIRNYDPNAYLTVKPVEFDPYDIRGRSTLKVIL
jgi:hypothetical protein